MTAPAHVITQFPALTSAPTEQVPDAGLLPELVSRDRTFLAAMHELRKVGRIEDHTSEIVARIIAQSLVPTSGRRFRSHLYDTANINPDDVRTTWNVIRNGKHGGVLTTLEHAIELGIECPDEAFSALGYDEIVVASRHPSLDEHPEGPIDRLGFKRADDGSWKMVPFFCFPARKWGTKTAFVFALADATQPCLEL